MHAPRLRHEHFLPEANVQRPRNMILISNQTQQDVSHPRTDGHRRRSESHAFATRMYQDNIAQDFRKSQSCDAQKNMRSVLQSKASCEQTIPTLHGYDPCYEMLKRFLLSEPTIARTESIVKDQHHEHE